MEIRERILKYIENKGISKYKFYQSTGLSNGFLDKEGTIGADKCEKISYQYPDLSLEWLITGSGSMLKSDVPKAVKLPEGSIDGIPLIPIDAMAGFGRGDTQAMEYECEHYVVPMFKGAEFLIQVRGSSMYPKYASGDIVACKKLPLDTFFQWNKVYVLDTNQGALIKRVKKGNDDDHIILVSENTTYDPFPLHRRDIHSLAIVIGVIRLE